MYDVTKLEAVDAEHDLAAAAAFPHAGRAIAYLRIGGHAGRRLERCGRSSDMAVELDSAGRVAIGDRRDAAHATDGGRRVNRVAWTGREASSVAACAAWSLAVASSPLASVGVHAAREVGPWHENAETWRRLGVVLDEGAAPASRPQVLYLDDAGRLRRHDYFIPALGRRVRIASYLDGHDVHGGVPMASRCRVYLRSARRHRAIRGPVLASSELVDLQLDPVSSRESEAQPARVSASPVEAPSEPAVTPVAT